MKSFYIRRTFRLLPALLVLLFGFSCIQTLLHISPSEIVKAIAAPLFYCANWAVALHWNVDLGSLTHTWSLSIEEQFYLLWPPILIILLRLNRPRLIAYVLFAGILMVGLWRGWLFWQTGDALRVTYGTDTRGDALLAGCFVASVMSFEGFDSKLASRIGKLLPLLLGALAFLVAFVWLGNPSLFLGALSAAAVGFALILVYVLNSPQSMINAVLRSSILVWIGRLSYSLYLWNNPMVNKFFLPHSLSWQPRLIASFALTFAVAIPSYYFIELPCQKIGHKLLKRAFQRPNFISSLPAKNEPNLQSLSD